MKRARAAIAMAVAFLVVTSSAALAAPGGQGGGGAGNNQVSFVVSPQNLSFSTQAGTPQTQTLTVTTKKASTVVNPTTSSDSHFVDTQTGTCWTQYAAIGQKIPQKTSCTIVIQFSSASAGSFSGTLTVTECRAFRLVSGVFVCDQAAGSLTVGMAGTATPSEPDLLIADIEFTTPSHYFVTVANEGTGPASQSVVQGYYSIDDQLDGADTAACGQSTPGGIAAGASAEVEIDCGFVPGPNQLYLIVEVDSGNLVQESDELNNRVAVLLPTSGEPDLIVAAVTVLGADASNPWNFVATIENIGTGNLDVETTIRVQAYYSVDPALDASDRAACGSSFGAAPDFVLAPGETVDVALGCVLRPVAGENYVLAEVDSLSQVTESNETNNVGRRVLPEIDLTITDLTIDSLDTSGITFTATIHLNELAPSPQVPIEMQGVSLVGVYSDDGQTLGNPGCQTFQTTSLIVPNGGTFQLTASCSNVPGPSETFLIGIADYTNLIAEFDELNNRRAVSLTAAPDLVVDSIVLTDTTNMDGWAYEVTIRNAGDATAGADALVEGWYSRDNILDAGDDPACGNQNAGSLAAGATQTFTFACAVTPASAQEHLIVELDRNAVVAESNEGNNTSFITLPQH